MTYPFAINLEAEKVGDPLYQKVVSYREKLLAFVLQEDQLPGIRTKA